MRGRRVRIYICDGDPRRISIDEWPSGRLASNRTVSGLRSRLNALTQRGTATLGGTLSANRRSFRGAVTLRNGRTIRFTGRRARGSALFVYRLVDGDFKTGLVQLPDGSERGTSYPPYIRGGELHSEERRSGFVVPSTDCSAPSRSPRRPARRAPAISPRGPA